MDFESDCLVEQLSRQQAEETYGLIVCALFHRPKPVSFASFYQRFTEQLRHSFDDDEKQSVYIYPIAHLHITIATLISFKHLRPESPDECTRYWRACFEKLKQTSQNKSIVLTLASIELSVAAGYFQFNDATNGFGRLRQSIRERCVPAEGQAPLNIPNIVHTSFLRFIKKPKEPRQLEEKFHRIARECFEPIRLDVDELCLALESRPYMHIDCDESHVLEVMKC